MKISVTSLYLSAVYHPLDFIHLRLDAIIIEYQERAMLALFPAYGKSG